MRGLPLHTPRTSSAASSLSKAMPSPPCVRFQRLSIGCGHLRLERLRASCRRSLPKFPPDTSEYLSESPGVEVVMDTQRAIETAASPLRLLLIEDCAEDATAVERDLARSRRPRFT